METPPLKTPASIIQRTGGLRNPWSSEARSRLRISWTIDAPRFGVNPTSCIQIRATKNVSASITARTRYGTPRVVAWAMTPPATVPNSMPAPCAIWPLAKADSSVPWYRVAFRPSTSHASVAPEKKANPSPSTADDSAQLQNGAWIFHISTYKTVETNSVASPSRYDVRLPSVSATMPVGTSKSTSPAVKKALAANAWVMERPASSRKSVLIPQMKDEAKVASNVSATYVLRIRPGLISASGSWRSVACTTPAEALYENRLHGTRRMVTRHPLDGKSPRAR